LFPLQKKNKRLICKYCGIEKPVLYALRSHIKRKHKKHKRCVNFYSIMVFFSGRTDEGSVLFLNSNSIENADSDNSNSRENADSDNSNSLENAFSSRNNSSCFPQGPFFLFISFTYFKSLLSYFSQIIFFYSSLYHFSFPIFSPFFSIIY
jgi:hypothetical protein